MQTARQRHHLETLRDHLRHNVMDSRFDLSTWAGTDDIFWEGNPDLSCGTSACAMGWATTIPEFQELGLHLRKYGGMGRLAYTQGAVTFEHFEAASMFLGITLSEAEYLFSPEEYPENEQTTRLEVIDRIDDFLLNGMPEEYPRYDEGDDDDCDDEEEDHDDEEYEEDEDD